MLERYDVVIVGAGVAGLNCALHLSEKLKVLLICKDTPDKSDSYLAQGGICRLQGEGDFESYFADTLRAGHGENDPAAVECMINSSPQIIDELVSFGVQFNRNADGSFAVTREGGHSRCRICYHADSTGREITTKLFERAQKLKNLEIVPQAVMLDIITDGAACYGIIVSLGGKPRKVYSDYTVFACGGIGGIYERSTNFRVLTGDGVAIALKHGVKVKNINYVQIHPTTLYSQNSEGRSFLISESVRGEGAKLLGKNLDRFTDELQPRDVVTAAIYKKMKEDGTAHVWLDMRGMDREATLAHFPEIVAKCAEEGIDVFSDLVPVVPAQHYFMGGVKSDLYGRTSLARLYAVGETCCNGVHGKNRLASNSLLESLLFARRAAENISASFTRAEAAKAERAGNMLDLNDYNDKDKVLEEYKKKLLAAIREAENE